jgi:hypothetical protein
MMKHLLSTTAIVLALATPTLAQNTPTHESRQEAREVTALNLLQAKGYRNFKTVRVSGDSFVVDATRNGKDVTVTINPDSGQIGI